MDQIIPAPAPTRTEMGNLSSLTTTQKGSIVGAINELEADVSALNSKMSWKLLQECNNNTNVGLPSEWNELFIIGTENASGSFAVWETASFIVPNINLTTYYQAVGVTGAKAFSYFSTNSSDYIYSGNSNSSLSTCVKYRIYYK